MSESVDAPTETDAEVVRLRVREATIVNGLWEAHGCASNPSAFKESVRDELVERMKEFARAEQERGTRLDRENRSLRETLLDVMAQRDEALAELAAARPAMPSSVEVENLGTFAIHGDRDAARAAVAQIAALADKWESECPLVREGGVLDESQQLRDIITSHGLDRG